MISASSTKKEWVDHMRNKHGEDCESMSKDEIIARATELEGLEYATTRSPQSLRTKEAQEIAKAKKVTLRIASTEDQGGSRPVFVSVNGVPFLIKRDEDVEVPRPVYEALRNARQVVFKQEDDGSLTPREVPSYPFSVVAA